MNSRTVLRLNAGTPLKVVSTLFTAMSFALFLTACSDPAPIAPERFAEPDRLFSVVNANISGDPDFEIIADIDHARLGAEAGSPMPPAHVLIWSNPRFDAMVVAQNPLAAIDLPFRTLAYEDLQTGKAKLLANSVDFMINRHGLTPDENLRSLYENSLALALDGIADDERQTPPDTMKDPGLVVLDSPFGVDETEQALIRAIESQGDTVVFGQIDFQHRAAEVGADVTPTRLILFGGPGPGGKAMAEAPTLGLDAFCQKLLVWQEESGEVKVAFNDLLAQAERLGVSPGLPLRIINRRLTSTFEGALEQ